MKFFVIFSIFFTLSSAITIDCNFRTIFLTMNSGYGCDGSATTDGSSQISSINGNHQIGRANNDTEVFRVWNACTLELIPQKIAEFFPNLVAVWFNDCKIKEIKVDDFVDMKNLVELDLAYNQMEFVHETAFGMLKNLQFLYLNNNRIIYVGPNVLQPLSSLLFVTFEDNSCISSNSFNFEDSDIRSLIIDVAIQCPLTMTIAAALLDRKTVEESRKYMTDLREIIDNAMMIDDDDEDEEVRFDDYRSSEPNDEDDEVKVSLHDVKIQETTPKLLSEANKLHESKKVAVKNMVMAKGHA